MNERFFSLPAERQGAIVNAAYAVFAADSYRHASTDDIAARAGISKGLLFHYFESKRELYRYLYRHSAEILRVPLWGLKRIFSPSSSKASS